MGMRVLGSKMIHSQARMVFRSRMVRTENYQARMVFRVLAEGSNPQTPYTSTSKQECQSVGEVRPCCIRRSLPSKAFQAKVQGIEKGNAEWTTAEPASLCASWQFPGPRRPPSITTPQLCKLCVDHVLLVCRNQATHPN